MLHKFRQLRRCIIILTIVTFSFGFGGNSELCFMPDGNVHVEKSHSDCGNDDERPVKEVAVSLDDDRDLSQGHCLDVSLERDTASHLHRNFIHLSAPAMVTLGAPIILTQTVKTSFRNTPAVTPPPQLVSLQSIILLI